MPTGASRPSRRYRHLNVRDAAFRQMYPTVSGIVMIDDLGKADGLGQIEAAALRYDRTGELAVKKRLQHDVSRVGVHPIGRGLIAMSRDCIVHAYDDQLDPMLETPLTDAPEILALRKRFDIPDDRLKNHIRCVALSRDANRYLFTTVDEAWCVDIGGKGLWGTKLPIKEGWTRVATPSNDSGTNTDFVREMERFETVGVEFTISEGVDEFYASDWIYAAGFAARSDAVYLAGYSGRVVLVNGKGEGVRVYDIGSVPRRIVDTGNYIYLLTYTRLYVLHDDALHTLVDTFDGGDLVVAQTSFGLLEKKRLRWFREDGQYLGSVVSKDPIRRVYSTDTSMIVETRQRRATILGVPTWWE